jgi:alpha-L-rhamnosidase
MKSLCFRSALLCVVLTIPFFSFAQNVSKKDSSKIKKWFPQYDFNAASFQKPSIEFAPFARWWWPGNYVNKEELRREINLFADNNFGGVEIQPLNLFVPGSQEERQKITSWDTPDYYENVKAVMEEARKRGLTVDMTDGSGWPPGGPHLSLDDGFQTLGFSNLNVKGGENISIALPVIANNTGIPSRLVAVLATKTILKKADDKTNTILLDPSSTIVLTKNVRNDSLYWKAPAGDLPSGQAGWKIIAFWSKPAGSKGMTATPVQGPVVDHFNTVKVLKNYEHLFGARTGLQPYFGNPMRSIFNDSYEFQVDRHYSLDFIDYFKKKRGYDITPWLPAEMQRKYNYASYMRPDAAPDFSFLPAGRQGSNEDWRLRYDYDLTLSELLGEHFFNTSKNWMEPQGLLHRTQAYGLNMDMIAQAGLASIPEAESMLGPEANLKIVTSGAHLYNRPIVSAESVVFINRAYTTTPQKIKLAVDKLFAAGVNQIIYHGVPYRYTPNELGPEGWYPFSLANFSSNLGEGNIFWKYQKEVNNYINRTQYALRSGKPHADVLIYFPFMEVDGMPDNPEEILTRGYIEGVEGPLPKNKELKIEAKEKWAEKVYPIINQFEASGITWDWVNDLSIQEAQLNSNKQINIRGNLYQALILANDSIIQLRTAQKINALASKGMNFIATGTLPHSQPSYLNWKVNDKKTKQFIAAALKTKSSKYIQNESDLNNWIKNLHQSVAFNGQYHFTRQVQREMSDGSRIQFIWNKGNQWQTLSLTLDKKYNNSYWMNADEGTVIKNNGSTVIYQMPPYGSVILYASTKKSMVDNAPPVSSVVTDKSKEIISLNDWNLKADSIEIKGSSLFDWGKNEQLKFSSAEGIYTSSFQWSNNSSSHFYLDLGKVCFTAEVYINGQFAGKRIYSPYMLDITQSLKQGTNQVEVRVTTGQLNGYIGKAKQGDSRYKQFKNKEDQLMSAGLLGPVIIREKIGAQD